MPDGAADQRVDASGIACGQSSVELRRQIATALLEPVTAFLARPLAIAARGHRPGNTRGQAVLPQKAANGERGGVRAAARVEVDGKLARTEPIEEREQALWRAGIESALGGDPLVAVAAARAVAFGNEEDHRHRRHALGRRRRRRWKAWQSRTGRTGYPEW